MTAQLLTTKEKAAELKCSVRHLLRLRLIGGGPPFTYVGRLVRYFPGNDWAQPVRSTAEAPRRAAAT